MATEDLTGSDKFVDDLVATNPVATDSVSDGDEHIRGVKNVLKNTLPNVTAAVTATAAQLNKTTSTFTGADGSAAGASGMVTAPVATDNTKFLKGDGTWATPSGGSSTTAGVIWDNHSTSTAYSYTNDGTAGTTSASAATDITVVDDKTLLLTHAADAGELRSVYIEKFVEVPGDYIGVTYRYYRLVSDQKIQLKFWHMFGEDLTTNLAVATLTNGVLTVPGQVDDSVGRADDNLAAPFNPVNPSKWYKYEVDDDGWLRYDFGTSTNIRKMYVQCGWATMGGGDLDYIPSTIIIEGSNDASTWTQIGDTYNNTAEVAYFSYDIEDFGEQAVGSTYWQLESFDDWDVIFASSTTTKLINNTSADAVIRARITAPTASASQTLSGLADVDTGAITLIDGAVLRYNGTASEWQNTNLGLSLTPTVTIPSTIYPSPTTVTITITNWSSYSSPAPWCEVENSSGTVVVAASAVTNNGDGTMTFTAPSTAATYTLKVKVQDFGDLVSSTVSTSMVVSEAPSYEYRYFRIGSLGSTGSGYLAVVEFYTSAGFTGTYYPPAMTSNSQTIGGVTYALSGYSYNNTSYQLWKMTDISGYDPTKTGAWMLGASATQKSDGWVFDLGTARDIVSARCKWYTYSLPNTYHSSPFTLYGSSNGSSWTAINTVTMGATNDGEYVDMLLG